MLRKIAFIIFLVVLLPLFAGAFDTSDIAGEYSKEVTIYFPAEDESEKAINRLKIEDLGENEIAFSTTLYFANGHQCALSGDAVRDSGKSFIFEDRNSDCRLAIRRDDKMDILLRDISEGGCNRYCGARGWFEEEFSLEARKINNSNKAEKK